LKTSRIWNKNICNI